MKKTEEISRCLKLLRGCSLDDPASPTGAETIVVNDHSTDRKADQFCSGGEWGGGFVDNPGKPGKGRAVSPGFTQAAVRLFDS